MKTLLSMSSAIALVLAVQAQAEITQDCILEGTVNQKRGSSANEQVHISFRSAKRGEEAPCRMTRSDRNRRIQFKAPDENDIADAPHGSKVRYRFTEEADGKRQWRLIERGDDRRL